jgi:DNA invertase Pin-like site-specific DNA recombinase
MRIGYARCSTADQSTAIQRARLEAAGCERVYQDFGVSGVARRRALERCLAALTAGDVLIVCSLDRLGRSLAQLIATIDELRRASVGFQSISEQIDTTTAQGTLVFHLLGALAQFERALIAERTFAGRQAAKERGVKFGRPRALSAEQLAHALELAAGGTRVAEVAKLLGCSRSSAYRALRGAARMVATGCRPGDRAMLTSEAGAELMRKAALAFQGLP